MVLFLHNRYRTTGGEESTVEDFLWLVRERLHEPAELLLRAPRAQPATRNGGSGPASVPLSERARAAGGLMRGGLAPAAIAAEVRTSGASIVHAHNLLPTFGWRALAAARGAGARVVLHLHQYRLVCAIGVSHTRGRDCTRCHGRNTLPGIGLNCRGSLPEALVYGASLALWQRRLLAQADALIVPSEFARERLRALGAPLPWERVHVLAPPLPALALPAPSVPAVRPGPPPQTAAAQRPYALITARLAPEKGIDVAIDACRIAGMPLVIAGEGPEGEALRSRSRGQDVRFVGSVERAALAELRAGATVALVPSRSAESFGLAAAEAMAAGLPVAGCSSGALTELLEPDALVQPDDARALAQVIARLAGDPEAGERARSRVRSLCAPEVVAPALKRIYDTCKGTPARL